MQKKMKGETAEEQEQALKGQGGEEGAEVLLEEGGVPLLQRLVQLFVVLVQFVELILEVVLGYCCRF